MTILNSLEEIFFPELVKSSQLSYISTVVIIKNNIKFQASFRTFSYFQEYKEQQFGHNLSNFANMLKSKYLISWLMFQTNVGQCLHSFWLFADVSFFHGSPKYTCLIMSYHHVLKYAQFHCLLCCLYGNT